MQMENKHVKRCLVVREMQTKPTVNYPFIPTRMAIIKKSNNKCWWRCWQTGAMLLRMQNSVTTLDFSFFSFFCNVFKFIDLLISVQSFKPLQWTLHLRYCIVSLLQFPFGSFFVPPNPLITISMFFLKYLSRWIKTI